MIRVPVVSDFFEYAVDATQRSLLFWDTLRERGNEYLRHEAAGKPPLLTFGHEMLLDGRTLEKPCNYALLRILPGDSDLPTDPVLRPFVVVDPRAGHGPGIGGFKADSEIGNALKLGHPVYFVTFFPEPVPGQRLVDVMLAEARFLELVRERHPDARGGPCVIGNCQAGWAIMGLAAVRPELPGPILIAGSPLSYWAGAPGLNPMRYTGGLLGGSWLTHLVSDLGNGRFDGANLVLNFEALNPANTWWSKYYNLLDKADTEPSRFLEFERWWGGYFLMNREEITAIVDQLFVGNKLARGEVTSHDGTMRVDLRNIRSPICVLCSWGDDITPPQQALNWILDLYASDDDLVAQGQTIVYCVHPKVGHLGIFVSGAIARKEHAGFVELLDLIEALPPGLYEMLIDDKKPGMRAEALVTDRYVTRFEQRSVDDIVTLCGDREGERPFEVVRKLSEVNAGLYEQLAAPVVQALSTEPMAAARRRLHPLRAQRWAMSDLNPMVWPVAAAAAMVRGSRTACAADNPFRTMERDMAKSVERAMENASNAQHKAVEQVFGLLYDTPLARAAAGLAGQSAPVPLGADPLRRDMARREAEALRTGAGKGTLQDGIVRILLLMMNEKGAIDERTYRALQAVRDELPARYRPTPAELHEVARRQALLLRSDRAAAVHGLSEIFTAPKDREMAETALRKAAALVGMRIDATPHGPMAVLLHRRDDAPVAERPTVRRAIDPAA